MPPTVVWEHTVPYTPRLVVLAQPVGFVHSPAKLSQVPILQLGTLVRELNADGYHRKKPKLKNQPDWDLNPGLQHHSPVA